VASSEEAEHFKNILLDFGVWPKEATFCSLWIFQNIFSWNLNV
jgi:hypothetical protein